MLDKLEGHASQKGRQPSGVVNATNHANQGYNLSLLTSRSPVECKW